jgi:hypothetical protein
MKLMPESLLCPRCVELGIKSQIRYDGSTKTLLGWSEGHYDELGQCAQSTDPNIYTSGFHCTEGHRIKYQEGKGEIERKSGDIPNRDVVVRAQKRVIEACKISWKEG